jgi:hypothetical protein
MSRLQWLSKWALVLAAAAVLATSWVRAAFAQADSDGDGFDGDELLLLPFAVGLGLIALLGWSAYRRRSSRSS